MSSPEVPVPSAEADKEHMTDKLLPSLIRVRHHVFWALGIVRTHSQRLLEMELGFSLWGHMYR